MPTISDLKRENQRLKNIQEGIKEMQRIQNERMQIARENKKLARDIKHWKKIKVISHISGGLARSGKGIFKGIVRYGQYLNEQEKKQKQLNRKLKSIKVKTTRIQMAKKKHKKRK